jgi:ligand-binding SRPBCC domain-containing protein
MRLLLRTAVAQPPAEVWVGFTRQLFLDLAPPLPQMRLLRFDGCQRGDQVEIELHLGPVSFGRWTSLITDHGPLPGDGRYFVDEGRQLPGPLRFWRHRHLLEPGPQGGCVIVEDLEYRTPLRLLDWLAYPLMWAQFAWRRPIYRRYFGRPR